MSLKKNSDIIIFGGIPYDKRGRSLGPFRVRSVTEKLGLTTSLIDYYWELPFEEITKHLAYCIGPNTFIFGISYTWLTASIPIDYATSVELLTNIINWIKIKVPNIKIVVGTASATTIPQNFCPYIDWIIDGFCELSLPALITHIKSNTPLQYSTYKNCNYIDSNTDYVVTDMNLLETMYSKQDNFLSFQPLTLETCRGCLFSCAYCTYAFRGKKNYEYIRTQNHLADELKRNYDLFGTTRYMIADDTFNDSEEKVIRIIKAAEQAKIPNFEYVCYLRPELLVSKPGMIDLLIQSGLRGAHIGLESFRNESRKIVGRSGDFQKIREHICLLKQKSARHIGILGSFIIGLPFDSIEDIENWNQDLCNDNRQFLDQWWFYPLFLARQNIGERITFQNQRLGSNTNQSLIERYPEKYGYTVDLSRNKDQVHVYWENKFMNYESAHMLSRELWEKAKHHIGIGGWFVASAWYNGVSDQVIRNGKLIDFNFDRAAKKAYTNRSNYWSDAIRKE